MDVGDETQYTDYQLRDTEIRIDKSCIYSHATAAFNYTTYDVRREQDTDNVNSQRCDIMLRSHETNDNDNRGIHPYWYARIVGIYHCNVYYKDSRTKQRLEFLFVRWFGQVEDWLGGPSSLRLNKIGFVPDGDETGAFGFLDPAQVLRACHIVPVYADGRTSELLDARSTYRDDSYEGDWATYYVNR